jgi:2-hydroxychromene-2-carboxylate isomerase
MSEIEFFFDPLCPWAWITSRFATEVSEQSDLDITWRFISLRVVNENNTDLPDTYKQATLIGSRLLRVAAAVQEHGGNDAVAAIYTEFGTRLHVDGASARMWKGEDPTEIIAEIISKGLAAAALPASLGEAADDESWDDLLRKETEVALSRTGPDVGTPIITFDLSRPDEASLFGPVINRIPRGQEAVDLWEAVSTVARTPGIAELKRSIRGDIVFT